MRFRSLMLVTLLAATLVITSAFAAVSVFLTGVVIPETITRTPAGNFFVTDARAGRPDLERPCRRGNCHGGIGRLQPPRRRVPACQLRPVRRTVSRRRRRRGSRVGLDNESLVRGHALRVAGRLGVTTPGVASGFGRHNGEVLVTNQGNGTESTGSVDIFTPRLWEPSAGSRICSRMCRSGAVSAPGFGAVGETLLVSDAGGGGILFRQPDRQGRACSRRFRSVRASGCGRWRSTPSGGAGTAGICSFRLNTRDIVVVQPATVRSSGGSRAPSIRAGCCYDSGGQRELAVQ